MTYLAFPLRVAHSGLEATADYPVHVEQMIEQVLFTGPGERVNRPGFGAGLLDLVFGPESEELAAAAQFVIQSNLQRELAQYIRVASVSASTEGSEFIVVVKYTLLHTMQQRTVRFQRARP